MLIGFLALFVQLSSFFKYGNIIILFFYFFVNFYLSIYLRYVKHCVRRQVEWNSFVLQFQ